MVPAPEADSKPRAPGEGRQREPRGRGTEEARWEGTAGAGGCPREPKRGRLDAGSPETSTAQKAAQPRAGPGPAKAPDGGRREEAAPSSGGEEERGEEGRVAGPLRASPGRAGLPGGREAGSAGRTQGEVSSCFPWLQRGGGEGAGTLAPGQGDSFFFFFLFKASPLPPGGARRCGRVEAGGGPHPTCPPRRNPPPRAGPFPEGPHLGPLAGPPDSSGAGRGGRPRPLPAPSKRETEAGGGGSALPRLHGGGEARWGWNPGLSLYPASLAYVGILSPQSHFPFVLVHSPLARGSVRGP